MVLVFCTISCKKETENTTKGTCTDGFLNNGEEMADCGGPCAPCSQPLVSSVNFYMRKTGALRDTFLFGDVSISNTSDWIITGIKDTVNFSFNFGTDAALGQHIILNSSNTFVQWGDLKYDTLLATPNSSVVITEHDVNQKVISGNFEAFFTNNSNSDTLYVTGGAFNDLIYQ